MSEIYEELKAAFKAIERQAAIITALEARVAALESEIVARPLAVPAPMPPADITCRECGAVEDADETIDGCCVACAHSIAYAHA